MKNIKWAVYALVATIFYVSCENDELIENEIDQSPTTEGTQIIAEVAEQAYPDRTGVSEEVYYGLNKINALNVDDQYVFEGDILFARDQIEKRLGDSQKSVGRTGGRWIDNIVYYEIDPNLSNQQRVTDAIASWEANTALQFVPRTNQADWIFFAPGGGCSSFVGRIGGRQQITLASGCTTGSTIHEIGHAVGLWHEQSRVDRDEYIVVNFDNIQPNAVFNFQTYAQQGADGNEFTAALDFQSIMLYGSFFFTQNGQPTITRLDGSTYNVNRTNLSPGDIEGINRMYPEENTGGDICENVAPWQSGVAYNIGDLVTYQNNLYERTNSGWAIISPCEVVEPEDICAGVSPWMSGVTYASGSLVTYQGFLYERNSAGWELIGPCN